jgi:DNA-directed RNA polymerases I, II, and III subunit RPABC1
LDKHKKMSFSDETYRIWRVRKTSLEMLKDRGYIVDEEEIELSFDDFKEKYSENISQNKEVSKKYATIS